MARPDEFSLIRLLTEHRQDEAALRALGVVTGIGDDAAVARLTQGYQIVMTNDMMSEGVHFTRTTMRDEDVGYKALASNISDIAAMGAVPKYALVALSASRHVPVQRLRAIYDGLYECADIYGVAIVGGDTSSSMSGIMLSVTLIGEIEEGKALLRSSARVGDVVFVTGHLGLSAAGLHYLLRQNCDADLWTTVPAWIQPLIREHCRPEPQTLAGRSIMESETGGALNDISDGLASEAWEIAEASKVGILLRQEWIPVHDALRKYATEANVDPYSWMLYGGEDYQLVGTVPSGEAEALLQSSLDRHGIGFYKVGEVTDLFQDVRIEDRAGSVVPLNKEGYNHFGSR